MTPEFIQVRHEEMAAFMACAHAKFTGDAGVCLATSGPGAIHLLNGLYDAKIDHQPVVAIVGQQATHGHGRLLPARGRPRDPLQGRRGRVRPHGDEPGQIRFLVDRAFRIARRANGHLHDRPEGRAGMHAVETPAHEHDTVHSGAGYSAPRVVPAEARAPSRGRRPERGRAGRDPRRRGRQAGRRRSAPLADMLGAGVAKALLGHAVVPDDLPFVTGPIGLLGSKPSWDMMMDATRC